MKITNNTVEQNKGGILLGGGSNNTISGNTIAGNSADYWGGGIWIALVGSNITISNNIITRNSAPQKGGGIYDGYSKASIVYNTITDNEAEYGGAIFGGKKITNNCFSNNISTRSEGGANTLAIHGSIKINNKPR